MGRSVLARSRTRWSSSTSATSRAGSSSTSRPSSASSAGGPATVGLPAGAVVWMWASGRYRSSDVYLAVMPLPGLEPAGGHPLLRRPRRRDPLEQRGARDAAVLRGLRRRALRAVQPAPRALPRALQQRQSARDPHVQRPEAWGPWRGGRCSSSIPPTGTGKFMHGGVAGRGRSCAGRHVRPAKFRDAEWGGEYGPYQMRRRARGKSGGSRIYFTLSTWNPYQVMLMTALVPRAVL